MKITFEVSDEAAERIEELMAKVNLVDRGELVRRSLQLYEWAVDEREKGHVVGSLVGSTMSAVKF